MGSSNSQSAREKVLIDKYSIGNLKYFRVVRRLKIEFWNTIKAPMKIPGAKNFTDLPYVDSRKFFRSTYVQQRHYFRWRNPAQHNSAQPTLSYSGSDEISKYVLYHDNTMDQITEGNE